MPSHRITSRVAEFFYDSESVPPADKSSGNRSDQTANASVNGTATRDIENTQIVAAADQNGTVFKARTKMVDIDRVTEALSDHWHEVMDLMSNLGRKAVAAHLAERETYSVGGAFDYTICYRADCQDTAIERSRQIGRELSDALRAVSPSNYDVDIIVDVTRLTVARGNASNTKAITTEGAPIRVEIGSEPSVAAESNHTSAPMAPPDAADQPMIGGGRIPFIGPPDNRASREVREKAATIIMDVTVGFRPVWSARTHAVMDAQSVLAKPSSNLSALFGEAAFLADDSGVLASTYDSLITLRTMECYAMTLAADEIKPLVLALHFGVLMKASAREYLSQILEGSEIIPTDLKLIELICPLYGFNQTKLPKVLSFIRRHSKDSRLRVPCSLDRIEGLECSGAGYLLTTANTGASNGLLAKFAIRAALRGMKCGLRSVDSPDQLADMAAAGYEVFVGDAIGTPTDAPGAPGAISLPAG